MICYMRKDDRHVKKNRNPATNTKAEKVKGGEEWMVNRAASAGTCPGKQLSWQAHCETSESSPCRDRKLPKTEVTAANRQNRAGAAGDPWPMRLDVKMPAREEHARETPSKIAPLLAERSFLR